MCQVLIGIEKVCEYESKNRSQINIGLQLDSDVDSKFDLYIPPKDSTYTSEPSTPIKQLLEHVTSPIHVPYKVNII